MPNLIKCMYFALGSVKLETVGLSLKISLKNTPRSAQELNDDCFTTLSKYFSSALVALFFTSNMLLIKTEG